MKGRPNILFVFADQHRWCDLGCYGWTEAWNRSQRYFGFPEIPC